MQRGAEEIRAVILGTTFALRHQAELCHCTYSKATRITKNTYYGLDPIASQVLGVINKIHVDRNKNKTESC